jgi:hypothetical protein
MQELIFDFNDPRFAINYQQCYQHNEMI